MVAEIATARPFLTYVNESLSTGDPKWSMCRYNNQVPIKIRDTIAHIRQRNHRKTEYLEHCRGKRSVINKWILMFNISSHLNQSDTVIYFHEWLSLCMYVLNGRRLIVQDLIWESVYKIRSATLRKRYKLPVSTESAPTQASMKLYRIASRDWHVNSRQTDQISC